jgi:hypothetical protein
LITIGIVIQARAVRSFPLSRFERELEGEVELATKEICI